MNPKLLASVRSLDEAFIAHAAGADIIDLKEPRRGALGALDAADVRHIVDSLGVDATLSATVGDLDCTGEAAIAAAAEISRAGVRYVKVGVFSAAADRKSVV